MKKQDVSSLEAAAGLTPGVSLNPFKWLLIKFVEGSPHSRQNTCKDTKKTFQDCIAGYYHKLCFAN